jgi:hypothetical protein
LRISEGDNFSNLAAKTLRLRGAIFSKETRLTAGSWEFFASCLLTQDGLSIFNELF